MSDKSIKYFKVKTMPKYRMSKDKINIGDIVFEKDSYSQFIVHYAEEINGKYKCYIGSRHLEEITEEDVIAYLFNKVD